MTQTALITGASSGIGLAFAQVLAREGYNLILVARSEDKLNSLKQELTSKHGINAVVLRHDLTKTEEVQQLFEQIEQQNLTVDALINNAGYGDYGEFADSDWEKLQGMILLNILALTHLSRLFLPSMIARGHGQILNVASTAAFQPGPMMGVYFATKAYVLSLSEAIAAETQDSGIQVTALCPGPTQSKFGEVAGMDKIPGMSNITNDKFPTAYEVAEYGYQCLQKGKVVAVHGTLNKVLTTTPRFVPRKLLRDGIKKLMSGGK